MTILRIKQRTSLVEEVCLQLAGEIRGELTSGDGWLPPERELAEKLGVSRPVVREATKRLELQGLLEVRHGIGTKVVDRLHAPLNGSLSLLIPDAAERLKKSLEVRAVIEPEVARFAAERASVSQLRELRKVHGRMEKAPDVMAAAEADFEFHRALANSSGNEMFMLILDSLADLGRESRRATISFAGVGRAVAHHAAILDAVERHAAKAAATAMQQHLKAATEDLLAKLNQKRKANA